MSQFKVSHKALSLCLANRQWTWNKKKKPYHGISRLCTFSPQLPKCSSLKWASHSHTARQLLYFHFVLPSASTGSKCLSLISAAASCICQSRQLSPSFWKALWHSDSKSPRGFITGMDKWRHFHSNFHWLVICKTVIAFFHLSHCLQVICVLHVCVARR